VPELKSELEKITRESGPEEESRPFVMGQLSSEGDFDPAVTTRKAHSGEENMHEKGILYRRISIRRKFPHVSREAP